MDYCPYEVLELSRKCTEGEIKKAFYKAALKWHPDKNPSIKDEAEKKFHRIREASAFLLDSESKAAYDNMLLAKEAKEKNLKQRKEEESSLRKQFREELEEREAEFNKTNDEKRNDAKRKLEEQLNKFRSSAWKIKNELDELIKNELLREEEHIKELELKCKAQLKVKWKYDVPSYTEGILMDIFNKKNKVIGIALSSENKTAIIEFLTLKDAIICEDEKGLENNPLKIAWITGRPSHLEHFKKISDKSIEVIYISDDEEMSKEKFLNHENDVISAILGDNWKEEYNFF
uniref:J domain-containing protein n=1 Tax=Parastrongyloides trichosuri TaxID=131310 RepID=A0A0N4ZK59_PARTI